MKNFSTKLLALVLSFLMCLYLFPTSVIAEALTDETEPEATEGTASESVKTENVFEVTLDYLEAQGATPLLFIGVKGKKGWR